MFHCTRILSGVRPRLQSFRVHRWHLSSSSSTEASASVTDAFVPEPPAAPPLPSLDASSSADFELALNALGEPTFAALGLATWWPSGMAQSLLETVHVSGGLGWCATVATVSVAARLAFLPFFFIQRRAMTKLVNDMPPIMSLQSKVQEAMRVNDHISLMKYQTQMEAMSLQGFSIKRLMGSMLVGSSTSMLIHLSMYRGLKEMARLPVHGLTTAGVLWFPDLTALDPWLPLLVAGMAVGVQEFAIRTNAAVVPMSTSSKWYWVMRGVLPTVVFVFTSYQPCVAVLYFTISGAISLSTSMAIERSERFRRLVNLPRTDTSGMKQLQTEQMQQLVGGSGKQRPKLKDEAARLGSYRAALRLKWRDFRETQNNRALANKVGQTARDDLEAFENAAKGAVPLTYDYDPTTAAGKKRLAQETRTASLGSGAFEAQSDSWWQAPGRFFTSKRRES